MDENKSIRVISWLSAGAVALIALFSFAISYTAQQELAVAAGIHPWLTFVFPLVIDGFIIVASLSVLRNSLVGERSFYQWTMVIFFTILSVIFNAAHAHDVLLDITVFGQPATMIPHVTMPVALFFGFEMLMRQIHQTIARTGTIQSLSDLRLELDQLQSDLETHRNELVQLSQQTANLEAEISEKATEVSKLEQTISDLQKVEEAAIQRQSSVNVRKLRPTKSNVADKAEAIKTTMQERRQAIQDRLLTGSTVGQLSDHFNVDLKTIQRDVSALEIKLTGRGRSAKMEMASAMLTVVRNDNGIGNPDEQVITA